MKTWLITGCSTGLGKSLAKAVLNKGEFVDHVMQGRIEEYEKWKKFSCQSDFGV